MPELLDVLGKDHIADVAEPLRDAVSGRGKG
jgi:hypothetical protein